MLIALPGRRPEPRARCRLALRYGRPLIAHLDDRSQIDGLSAEAEVTSDFAAVQRFVRAHLVAPGQEGGG